MPPYSRRRFLLASLAGTSGALLTRPHPLSRPPELSGEKPLRRPLGRTGLTLPIVSMGVMRADNPGLVRAALKAGLTHLDTAHGYQKGKNEEMLGTVLSEVPRESFVLGTKIQPDDRESFLAKLEKSLERLRMASVDILYLHSVSSRDEVLSPELVGIMKEIKAAGKARHIGLSTHKNEPEVLRAAAESGVYEVVLTSLNFRQDHAAEMKAAIAAAAEKGIGIVAMKTMAGAYFDRERTRPINCVAALKWALQNPQVTTAIPGITSFDQLAANAAVLTGTALTPEEESELRPRDLQGGLYCNGCSECVGTCPRALPIPEMMRAFMYTHGYVNGAMGRDLLAEIGVGANPCAGCASCSASCVKGFDLRARIADVSRLTAIPRELCSGAEYA